jgi:nucleolar protein 56
MLHGPLVRRAFLRLGSVGVGVGVFASLTGCLNRRDPSFTVREAALTDEVPDVRLDGLSPGAEVLVRARARSRNSRFGGDWEARARFEVDDGGRVVLEEAVPLEGTYEGSDPTGLLWSMRPTAVGAGELPPAALFTPEPEGYEVTLAAEVCGATVAEVTTTRRLYDAGIERRRLDGRNGLVGGFFAPPGGEPAPGVLHLHGAGGRPHLATGRLLASRGFATLALQYVGDPDPLPDSLAEVPLEYVERAVEWLRRHDQVADAPVGLVGFSRGGELALLSASRAEEVGAVVGWVPSGVVWEGLDSDGRPAGTAAWSVDGEPVPYLALAEADPSPPPAPSLPYFEPALRSAGESELEAASVPVERMGAPVLLVSADDDRRWPSAALSERVVDRLEASGYPHVYRHVRNRGAGHYLRLPYLPTAGTTRDQFDVYGGGRVANARASERAWVETHAFLEDALST